jgi:hypothetical protein
MSKKTRKKENAKILNNLPASIGPRIREIQHRRRAQAWTHCRHARAL